MFPALWIAWAYLLKMLCGQAAGLWGLREHGSSNLHEGAYISSNLLSNKPEVQGGAGPTEVLIKDTKPAHISMT